MDLTDKPVEVRAEDALDTEKLGNFMKETFPELSGDLTVQQYPGGASNLTYLLTIGSKEFIMRRPPFGRIAKSAHNMGREYRILKALRPVFPYCPKVLAYSDNVEIAGAEFFIMERIRGIILRKDLPEEISYTTAQARKLCESLLDVQVELHSIDIEKAGLGNIGKPEGYVKRQVDGWIGRYRQAKTENVPDFENVIKWILEKMPPDTKNPTMIHNDYRFDNTMIDEHDHMKIVGVLDWEMSTIGDPLMDFGNSLVYWVEADATPETKERAVVPIEITATVTREELIQWYAAKSGQDLEYFDFYFCFGLFRLAGIVQQIYYRFFHGQTHNEKFEDYNDRVRSLEEAALELIGKSNI